MKIRRRTKNLILLTTITLILSLSTFIAFNHQPIAQNTLAIPTQPTSPTTENSKMGTHLQQLLQTSVPSTEYEMIIFFEKTVNYTQGINLIKNLGNFEIISNYTILNGIWIKAPIGMAENIVQLNYVRSITYNEKIILTNNQITTNEIQIKYTGVNTAIGADKLQTTYGLNGTGVVVAVLDSGINPHIYLPGSRIIYNEDFTGEGYTDLEGHGTAVAGIIGASGGTAKGVAPAVEFLNLKVLNQSGEGSSGWLLDAIDEALNDSNPAHPKADIISLSLGHFPGDSNDQMSKAANDAWILHDTIIVAAAGNEGGYGYETINSPGLGAYIITVGSASGLNYGSVSSFSSRGPTDDNRAKPDLVAPGVDITTLSNDGSGTTSFSGTSASTPVVSGAIALLLDNSTNGMPWLSPNTVKATLMMTARDLGLNPFRQGTGLINISKAYDYLQDYYINRNNTTPPLIVTPIRAISTPMTLNNVTPTILNLTIIVGNVTTDPIIKPIFRVTGNASSFIFGSIGSITSPLDNTQEFVRIRFLVPSGESPDHFSGDLELVNNTGSGVVLFTISLGIYSDRPSWPSLLPTFLGLDQTTNLLLLGGIVGVATICLIGLIAGVRARRRKPEAPPDYEFGWDEWPPPPPPPDWFY
ncbi:MAG: S8 family serine peptidase [Candidatus Lokiarchaeia archaeon]